MKVTSNNTLARCGASYTAPQCKIHEIQPEGALCISFRMFGKSSLEQLEMEEYYTW